MNVFSTYADALEELSAAIHHYAYLIRDTNSIEELSQPPLTRAQMRMANASTGATIAKIAMEASESGNDDLDAKFNDLARMFNQSKNEPQE